MVAVELAKAYALLQVMLAGFVLLFTTLGQFSPQAGNRGGLLAGMAGSLVLAVMGVAFLRRKNWARLFQAGLHVSLALAAISWELYAVATRRGALVFLLILPALFCAAGAFLFVSVAVRRYCGENLVTRDSAPGSRGPSP